MSALRKLGSSAAFALILLTLSATPATAAEEFDKFAVESVSASLSTKQAGAHADMRIAIEMTHNGNEAFANAKDIEVELPPGVIGNPSAVPRCTVEQLGSTKDDSACPFESQVGMTRVRVMKPAPGTYNMPVYNMVAPKGSDIVARLGFIVVNWPAFVNIRIDPTDYSVIAHAEGLPSAAGLSEATTTLWGVPSASIHDEDRVTPAESFSGETPSVPRTVTARGPFLSNPTDCATPRQVRVSATSYQLPDSPSTKFAPFPQITGCGQLNFDPTFSARLTNPEAAAPSGLDTELTIPQDESPQGNATSVMKSARVTLPEGISINPAAADGLEACSAEQVRYGQNVDADCPDAAKIGTIEAVVPALQETLHGSVYQRAPEAGRLFGLWVVADEQGVHLKLPARIEADPASGRLTTVFDGIESLGGLPQVPFSSLKLNIFGGPRAPLATPPCGTYLASHSFVPWSGKPPVEGQTALEVTQGCGKGGFAPKLSAGSLNPFAGAHTPFAFTLTRQDGEANPQTIALHLPQGLLAKLAGVPLCPEAAAASGACPAASRIGSLAAASGVGGAPLWLPQPGKAPTAAYLAGPYRGAPYSVVSVVPAQAGPFDLGTVVNRAAIQVDPKSATATIQTDPLPQIIEGVPVSYRTIHVLVDRAQFTLNPTGCEPKQIAATVIAANGQSATPTDGFQATRCSKLGFKPRLSLALKGATKRGAHPALRSVYRPRAGDANLARLSVALPRSAFLEQAHLNTICTRVQFAAGEGHGAQCPPGSVYGQARATTPLLSEPLSGPVYLRSSSNELPDLVLALDGQLEIEASARIDSIRGGIRATFTDLPDAPIAKVVVDMQGAKKGLIVNSANLCKSANRAEVSLAAHNGRRAQGRPAVRAVGCGKSRRLAAGK